MQCIKGVNDGSWSSTTDSAVYMWSLLMWQALRPAYQDIIYSCTQNKAPCQQQGVHCSHHYVVDTVGTCSWPFLRRYMTIAIIFIMASTCFMLSQLHLKIFQTFKQSAENTTGHLSWRTNFHSIRVVDSPWDSFCHSIISGCFCLQIWLGNWRGSSGNVSF